jgi:hypothetical protein
MSIMTTASIVLLLAFAAFVTARVPLPFTRVITQGAVGKDGMTAFPFFFFFFFIFPDPFIDAIFVSSVVIAQNLLTRFPSSQPLNVSGIWDVASSLVLSQFQTSLQLPASGDLDYATAFALLVRSNVFSISVSTHLNRSVMQDHFSLDGVIDDGFSAKSMGYKYKFVFMCSQNRSIEHDAKLFDADNNLIHTFKTRLHGYRDDGTHAPFPDFGANDIGLNQFSSDGATVTGIIEIDLNSPEDNSTEFGPWPVNRLVRGLKGNAQWLLPNIRDGQLLHTGVWSTPDHPWDESKPMPNSEGCIHAHPIDIQTVFQKLVAIGVVVRPNPFSGKHYPYQPQGIAVVQQI